MQNTIQKFRQSSIIFEKPGILSKNLETLTSSNYPTVQYLFAETSHTFSTNHPAGNYWSPGRPLPTSPGRPLKILFERPGDVPIWRSGNVPIWRPGDVPIWRPRDVLKWRPGDVLIWRSRDVPGRLIRDVPRTFSGRPLEDLESTQTWMSNFFF